MARRERYQNAPQNVRISRELNSPDLARPQAEAKHVVELAVGK